MFTKNVFKDLAIFMIGFGVVMGIVFPFFVILATKTSTEIVLTPLFFGMCIAAGFMVGLFNICYHESSIQVMPRGCVWPIFL